MMRGRWPGQKLLPAAPRAAVVATRTRTQAVRAWVPTWPSHCSTSTSEKHCASSAADARPYVGRSHHAAAAAAAAGPVIRTGGARDKQPGATGGAVWGSGREGAHQQLVERTDLAVLCHGADVPRRLLVVLEGFAEQHAVRTAVAQLLAHPRITLCPRTVTLVQRRDRGALHQHWRRTLALATITRSGGDSAHQQLLEWRLGRQVT